MTEQKAQGFEAIRNVYEQTTNQPPRISSPYIFGSQIDFQSGATQSHQIPVTTDQHPLRASPCLIQQQELNENIQQNPDLAGPYQLRSTAQVQTQSNMPQRETQIRQGEQHPLTAGYSGHQMPDFRSYGPQFLPYTSHPQMHFPPQRMIYPGQLYPIPMDPQYWGQINTPWSQGMPHMTDPHQYSTSLHSQVEPPNQEVMSKFPAQPVKMKAKSGASKGQGKYASQRKENKMDPKDDSSSDESEENEDEEEEEKEGEEEEEEQEKKQRKVERVKERIFNFIVKAKDLKRTVDELSRHTKSQPKEIRKMIKMDDRLLLSKDMVSLRINLSVCKNHMTDDGCDEDSCESLHICPKFLVGLCSDKKCDFGHDIDTHHNHEALSQNNLENVDFELLRKLVKLDNIAPDVCEDYNFEQCSKGHKCIKMHICVNFIMGTCEENCELNHDINDSECKKLLQRAHADQRRTQKEWRIFFRKSNGNWEEVTRRNEERKRKKADLKQREEQEPMDSTAWSSSQKKSDEFASQNGQDRSALPLNQNYTNGALQRVNEKETLAQKMKRTCQGIDGFIHELPRKQVNEDRMNRLANYEIGERGPASGMGKVLMLVGATGAGKTTLINGMVNYLYGVQWEDPFRLKLIGDESGEKSQAHSQTKWITAYVLHQQEGFRLPCTLTVIDTPGFGDTEGIKADDELRIQIHKFFSHGGSIGVDQLDGICFVVQASLARLTHTQKYIFDSILAVFGKDVEKIIYVLTTFADGQKPPVLVALKDANIPCKNSFKVNNSAFFVKPSDEPDAEDLNGFFWKMGISSFEKFFKDFLETKPVSLTLTQDVLKERKHLEAALQGILPQIKTAMARAERVRQTYLALKQHEAEADANKNFNYTVKVPKHKKVNLDSGTYVTNCLNCNFTCHYPCYIPNDKDKAGCAAMHIVEGTACCNVCLKKCVWHKHVNNEYRFETYEEEEEHTYKELKKKYEDASGKRLNAKGVLNELIKDFNVERTKILKLTKEAHKCLQKLDKIALKPDPLGITEYIDLLIESEKREAKPGFEQRITYLLDAKEKAKLAENLKEDFDPLEECMREFRDLGMNMSDFESANSQSRFSRACQKVKQIGANFLFSGKN